MKLFAESCLAPNHKWIPVNQWPMNQSWQRPETLLHFFCAEVGAIAKLHLYTKKHVLYIIMHALDTPRAEQNGRHFADAIFNFIFSYENCFILIKMSLNFVHRGSIQNKLALVQIMAWHQRGDKPLSVPRMDQFNALWPGDATSRNGTRSTLAQVMACCLTAPCHYLNQCWLIINKVFWHSSEGNFVGDASATIH